MPSDDPTQPKNWLPHYLELAKSNPNKLATKMGENRQTISRVVKRVGSVPRGWADRIAMALNEMAPDLNVTPMELMFGPGSTIAPEQVEAPRDVAKAAVGGRTAAGVWLADDFVDTEEHPPIPIVLARYANVKQTAYRVVGPSMDLARVFDGEYVITVPYWEARVAFQDNDIVVVEQRQAHKIERTCKQVTSYKDRVELWPRSSDERFKTPIIVYKDKAPEDGLEIEVVGLVIGKHVVFM